MPLQTAQSGFTLIELMVALVLLGLLAMGLGPSVRLEAHAWDAVDASSGEAAEAQTAQDFLRRSITEAYPAWFIDQDGRRSLAYAGEPQELSMVTEMPSYLGLGGLQIIHIEVQQNGDHRDLVAVWSPLTPGMQDLSPGEASQKAILAGDVDKLDLLYFGREAPNEPPAWFATWEGHTGLPKLVRVRLTFPPGSQRSWPDLIARPMVDLGAMVKK